jgi:RimJ/RimL family protein N-acetyltransferase
VTIRSERLELVPMSPEFLEALVADRRGDAERIAGFSLPPDWPDAHDLGFLRLRLGQIRGDPARREWLVHALVLPGPARPMVGHAGFHGPPGVNAKAAPRAVEVGYTVFEPFRGRGYATEAVRALVSWASRKHGITHFVASVGPDNEPSLAIVRKLGFRETGEHWDEDDGPELEFELVLA